MEKEEIRKTVRERYGSIAIQGTSCCGPQASSCCGGSVREKVGKAIGYSDEDLKSAPDGANLGLGCGNPIALASLKDGEVVLDLGSGAGFDCFLAAGRVGAKGKVIGVDMTAEMLEKARENARKGGYKNVEFRLGEIEHLPVADGAVDIIISNCVINLSPDKDAVFKEAYRVLKPGGRLMVSDIVLLDELPEAVQTSVAAYVSCLAGAALKEKYLGAIRAAGFGDVEVVAEDGFDVGLVVSDPTVQSIITDERISADEVRRVGQSVRSVKVSARKK